MGINYKANSLLGFVFAVSLVVYYYGIYAHIPELSSAAEPFLWIFGAIWGCFIALTIVRNAKKL